MVSVILAALDQSISFIEEYGVCHYFLPKMSIFGAKNDVIFSAVLNSKKIRTELK